MPIRNPFRRAPEATEEAQRIATDNGFKNTAVSGAQPLQTKDSTEYKLSGEIPRASAKAVANSASHVRALTVALEINDSGVYLPVSCSPET